MTEQQTTAVPRDPRVQAEIDRDLPAVLTQEDGRWVLAFRRELDHPVERVWALLTEPDQLTRWSPVVPSRPLTSPGAATSRENPGDDPVDAEVLAVDPPRSLVHRWGPGVLAWTLEPSGTGSVLTLRHTFDEPDMKASYAAGWRICLGALAADAERVVGPRAVDYGWQALRDHYAETLA